MSRGGFDESNQREGFLFEPPNADTIDGFWGEMKMRGARNYYVDTIGPDISTGYSSRTMYGKGIARLSSLYPSSNLFFLDLGFKLTWWLLRRQMQAESGRFDEYVLPDITIPTVESVGGNFDKLKAEAALELYSSPEWSLFVRTVDGAAHDIQRQTHPTFRFDEDARAAVKSGMLFMYALLVYQKRADQGSQRKG